MNVGNTARSLIRPGRSFSGLSAQAPSPRPESLRKSDFADRQFSGSAARGIIHRETDQANREIELVILIAAPVPHLPDISRIDPERDDIPAGLESGDRKRILEGLSRLVRQDED